MHQNGVEIKYLFGEILSKNYFLDMNSVEGDLKGQIWFIFMCVFEYYWFFVEHFNYSVKTLPRLTGI